MFLSFRKQLFGYFKLILTQGGHLVTIYENIYSVLEMFFFFFKWKVPQPEEHSKSEDEQEAEFFFWFSLLIGFSAPVPLTREPEPKQIEENCEKQELLLFFGRRSGWFSKNIWKVWLQLNSTQNRDLCCTFTRISERKHQKLVWKQKRSVSFKIRA